MTEQQATGVYQLDNGYWGYRFVLTVNGKKKAQKRVKDELGNPYKTQKQAAKARSIALAQEQAKIQLPPQKQIIWKNYIIQTIEPIPIQNPF